MIALLVSESVNRGLANLELAEGKAEGVKAYCQEASVCVPVTSDSFKRWKGGLYWAQVWVDWCFLGILNEYCIVLYYILGGRLTVRFQVQLCRKTFHPPCQCIQLFDCHGVFGGDWEGCWTVVRLPHICQSATGLLWLHKSLLTNCSKWTIQCPMHTYMLFNIISTKLVQLY